MAAVQKQQQQNKSKKKPGYFILLSYALFLISTSTAINEFKLKYAQDRVAMCQHLGNGRGVVAHPNTRGRQSAKRRLGTTQVTQRRDDRV